MQTYLFSWCVPPVGSTLSPSDRFLGETLAFRSAKLLRSVRSADGLFHIAPAPIPEASALGAVHLPADDRSTGPLPFAGFLQAARRAIDRPGSGQALIFASAFAPNLSATAVEMAAGRLRSTGAAALVAVVAPAQHPCILKRQGAAGTDASPIEVPGLWGVRDGSVVDIRTGRPLFNRQTYPPVVEVSGALVAVRGDAIEELADNLARGKAVSMAMERSEGAVASHPMDLVELELACPEPLPWPTANLRRVI